MSEQSKPVETPDSPEARDFPVLETFESFYSREYRPLLAYALALIGDRSLAEDLTQDAFVAAYKSWNEITDHASWLRKVVSNKTASAWRRFFLAKRTLPKIAEPEAIDTPMSFVATEFWAEVRRLPGQQAQAITLFYLEDRPVSEISEILGCSESSTRTHLSRGRKTLASTLGVEE